MTKSSAAGESTVVAVLVVAIVVLLAPLAIALWRWALG